MAGRPTEYKEEYNVQVEKLCKLGATDKEIADFFEVAESIISLWKQRFPKIKEIFDRRIELMKLREIEREEARRLRRIKRSQPHIKKADNDYRKKILKENPKERVRNNFASQLRHHLKSKNKKHTFSIVGYSVEELMVHLESQFKPGMSWENYGRYWHIDHKTPVSWFSYQTEECEDFKKCWALSNLQPLESQHNLLKSNRYASA